MAAIEAAEQLKLVLPLGKKVDKASRHLSLLYQLLLSQYLIDMASKKAELN